MKTVRIWFKKIGAARFISHLDLNRCMSRTVHMAKIPLWYTQGFNPHAFITFALPLSLGMIGERESMDIKIDETKITNDELLEQFKRALPEDLPVFSVTVPKMKPGKIKYASYTIKMEPEKEDISILKEKWKSFLEQEKILVEKRSKNGKILLDIKPDIQKLDIKEETAGVITHLVLPAGSEYNINPFLLTETFQEKEKVGFFCECTRHALYDASMKLFE